MTTTDRLGVVEAGIAGIQTAAAAIDQSKGYIAQSHPHVKADLAAMCAEMSKTLNAVAVALSIVPHLRASVALAPQDDRHLAEQLDRHLEHAHTVETPLNALRGRCGVIRDHADRIEAGADGTGWRKLTELLSFKSDKFEKDIAEALNSVYDDEMQFHHNVYGLRDALESALSAVKEMFDSRGPDAARKLLVEYADRFNAVQVDANFTAIELQETIAALS